MLEITERLFKTMPFSGHILAEESSIPALKHVINSKSPWRQRFWLVALLVSLGLLIFHTVRLTQHYLEYEINVQYRSLLNDTFVMPTIFISYDERYIIRTQLIISQKMLIAYSDAEHSVHKKLILVSGVTGVVLFVLRVTKILKSN